jgi:hypothetical protein
MYPATQLGTHPESNSTNRSLWRHGSLRIFLILTLLFGLSEHATLADSATWNLGPTSGDWNTAGNWTPATVPNGPTDTAIFGASNITNLSLSASVEVNGIAFNSDANAFTITLGFFLDLTISGAGITNNSAITQHFVSAVDSQGSLGTITFANSATAGTNTAFTAEGAVGPGPADGGLIQFIDSSTAGGGSFIANAGTGFNSSMTAGGETVFFDSSTADSGTFTANGATDNLNAFSGGLTTFRDTSTAGNATFITNGGTAIGAAGGATQFFDSSTAGNGTFIINGGTAPGAAGGRTSFDSVSGGISTAGNGTFIANGGTNGGMVLVSNFPTARARRTAP